MSIAKADVVFVREERIESFQKNGACIFIVEGFDWSLTLVLSEIRYFFCSLCAVYFICLVALIASCVRTV